MRSAARNQQTKTIANGRFQIGISKLMALLSQVLIAKAPSKRSLTDPFADEWRYFPSDTCRYDKNSPERR
eukprot:5444438-Amphidinium_carterae.1